MRFLTKVTQLLSGHFRRTAARRVLCCALLLCTLPAIAGDDAARVDVEIYFSKEDKQWPAAEQALEQIARQFAVLRLNKFCIDDPANYRKLSEAEKNLGIDETGEITLVFGPFYLTSRGERRDIENYFGTMVARVMNPANGKGRIKADAAGYAAEIFGATAKVEDSKDPADQPLRYYRVMDKGKHVGWVADVYRAIHCPVCSDTQFLLAIGAADLKIVDLRPVRELERWGRPIEKQEAAGFTGQFKGRTPATRDAKVDAITRATKTTRAYEGAINEALKELKSRSP